MTWLAAVGAVTVVVLLYWALHQLIGETLSPLSKRQRRVEPLPPAR